MKDYSDILKDVESGKYIKKVPPDGTPVHEIGHSLKQISVSVQYLEELRRISESAEAQAKIAKEEADRAKKESKEAKKDAKFSKCISIVSLGITIFFSVAQIIVQLIQRI